MKTLELAPFPLKHFKNHNPAAFVKPQLPVVADVPLEKNKAHAESGLAWLEYDSSENVSLKEAAIRGAFVITMPILSAIDWTYKTHTMVFIAPVIFYLEVSAFTMYCPVKALFSKYKRPVQ